MMLHSQKAWAKKAFLCLWPSDRSLLTQFLICLFLLSGVPLANAQISFDFSTLNFNGQGSINGATSLEFGPDGKLYVAERYGFVKVITIERDGPSDYDVVSSQTIDLVKSIPNHNDDGSNVGNNNRQVTGLTVTGTANNPVIYVSSSDARIGGGGSGSDINLDTNSGIITRLTKNGNSWSAVDIVRGLPRSEENHATNGMEFRNVNGTDYLIVCSGGFTNAGAPSNNFAFITEYALGAAILSINLTQLDGMQVKTDPGSGRQYIYDIPTLDDPTRPNANGITDPDNQGYNGIDQGDPFGGNDGLNQAMLVPGGPVQIFSPGYRNTYDLVITDDGKVYATENGANGGWGGYPENEASPNVTNNYRNGEPGSTGSDGNEAGVNNKDHLQLITTNINSYNFGSYYGGHPTPVRANVNAGLYTHGNHSSGGAYFRTVPYDPSEGGEAGDPTKALPANWPPVPASMINVDNADFRNPGDNNPDGQNDNPVTTWQNNTNGIDEYTASNFGGIMQGNLIAGKSGGSLHRVALQGNGQIAQLEQNKFSTQGGNPLGVTCQGDNDIFPGSIWVGTFDGRIVVLEPNDFAGNNCIQPGEPGYDPNADNDNDGYTNQDEIDNGTDICSGASQPNDFDTDFISDLNDLDDDGDGINDDSDPFQLGQPFDFPVTNELFSDNLTLGGYLGLGLTGLMNNGDPNPNYLDWMDDPNDPNSPVNDIYGGAIGAVTIYQTAGDAFNNDQEKAFQYGVNVDQGTGNFKVECLMMPPFHNHTGGESQGLFLGTGFQNDYIKLVLGANGLEVLGENGGANLGGLPSTAIANPTSELILILAVDPVAATIQAKYSVNGGPVTDIGTPFAVNGAVKNAIQQSNNPLAVGLIGTNAGNGEFAANWDYLNVLPDSDAPIITQNLPDLNRTVGAPADVIDLDQYFDDNNGHANLSYTVEQNSNPVITANINGNNLTLTYPNAPASTTITIRATDQGGLFIEQTFNVTVSDPGNVLFRINTGGPAVTAIDGGLDWEEDSGGNPSQYLQPGSNTVNGFNVDNFHASVDQSTTPGTIFDTERWDPAGGTEMKYSFPVSQSGNYEVRLYLANGYVGTSNPGSRIFSVSVEGSIPGVYQDIDLSATYGHLVGAMLSYTINVTDGTLDIEFIHNVENPLINGIEILGSGGGGNPSNPISLNGIPNQSNEEGDNVSLNVQASGGDGALVYTATGLPPGLTINANTGLISGTIAAGANNNSPYNVSVSVDDSDGDNTDTQTTTFSWTIQDGSGPGPGPGPSGNILFRVNAGGPTISAIDGGIDWEEDTQGNNSQYLSTSGSNYTSNQYVTTLDASVDANTTPDDIFISERSDFNGGGAVSYSFPVTSGDYELRLYMGNGYGGTANPGTRIFSVNVEGIVPAVYQSIDLSATYGHKVGAMISYTVNVTDGNLDFTFIHDVENPLINGIEILTSGGTQSTPISLLAIPDQTDEEGDNANVTVTASGGDGNLVYSATNLPPGVSIDPTNGLIGGTILAGAADNSPYLVTVTVDDSDTDNTDIKTTTFTWTINPSSQSNAILLSPIANQTNTEGDNVSLAAQASGGDGALSYSATGLPPGLNIDPVTGVISGTIYAGASANSPYTASVTVDDSDGDLTDTQTASFSWVVNPSSSGPNTNVLYRVNTGGPTIAAIDGSIDWGEDSNPNPSPYFVSGSATTAGFPMQGFDPSVDQSTTPTNIFNSERWDVYAAPEMAYSFPVSQAGDYEVRLYMGNGYAGTQNPGTRVYSVSIEGSIPSYMQNIDLSGTYGHQIGAMISHTVTVTDGSIDIEFIHNIENPLINGIEILEPGGTPPPPPPPGNTAPVALMSATPTTGTAPLLVSFDASASFDNDNDPLTYTWDFGDGNTATGITATHTYNTAGTFTATLTVNDGNGGTDQATEIITVSNPNPCTNGSITYVSDLNWVSAQNDFGAPKIDKSNGNNTLTINGQTYAKGIGAHAYSEIVYNINGQYQSFKSDIGIDDETCASGSVIFKVVGDGVLLYESPLLTQADFALSIDVDVTGVNQLTLIVDKATNNYWCDHADWADARLESNCNGNRNPDQNFASSFSIYPNPTQSGKFLIEADIAELQDEIEVEIWSMDGSLIKREKFNQTFMRMSIGENRADGIYLVKVKYQDSWTSYRILKMK